MYPRGRTHSQGRTGLSKRILNSCTGLGYRCKDCGQWLSTYHNSHKNHFSACKRRLKEAKNIARRIEKHGTYIKRGSRVLTLHHHLEPEGGNLQVVSIPGNGIHSFSSICQLRRPDSLIEATTQLFGPAVFIPPEPSITPTPDTPSLFSEQRPRRVLRGSVGPTGQRGVM